MENNIEKEFLIKNFNISTETIDIINRAEASVCKRFAEIDSTAQLNQWRVMKAFSENRVSDAHFTSTTGYGYDDLGRDTLDKVYADIFGAEDALVRHNMISGTHAISTALFGVLRTGDLLVSITGKPYDTLEEVIGISGEAGNGSLMDFGVKYQQIELLENGMWDEAEIVKVLSENKVKAVEIQRSRGYSNRPSYSAKQVGEMVSLVKSVSPDTICIVDNCYGEFVDECEPTAYGADLIIGSLIKNPGGGLAPTGGYIAGKAKYVELCSYRLTSVGIGKECGASLGLNRSMYQGLFMAPHIVAQALKGAILCAKVFEDLGYEVSPSSDDERHDIIESVILRDADKLKAFCRGIQQGAPVDSFVTPEPWDMPGYNTQVIMAAGAFTQGSSIELSADGPMKEPYIAFMQGGLTYESAKLGIMMAAEYIRNIK